MDAVAHGGPSTKRGAVPRQVERAHAMTSLRRWDVAAGLVWRSAAARRAVEGGRWSLRSSPRPEAARPLRDRSQRGGSTTAEGRREREREGGGGEGDSVLCLPWNPMSRGRSREDLAARRRLGVISAGRGGRNLTKVTDRATGVTGFMGGARAPAMASAGSPRPPICQHHASAARRLTYL